mgnify:CR=1 FL=1
MLEFTGLDSAEENTKFERYLPTVPIQSKLRKDVITSDLVTVSLEVDITYAP